MDLSICCLSFLFLESFFLFVQSTRNATMTLACMGVYVSSKSVVSNANVISVTEGSVAKVNKWLCLTTSELLLIVFSVSISYFDLLRLTCSL